MSDLMLYGVLRMPYEMTMGSELSRYQFYQRVQEAADRLEKAERRLAEIDAASTIPASEAGELPPLPKAAAWQHTMDNTEGIKGNEPHVVLSFGKRNPFGKAGIDYSKSFPVTADPLFTADQMRDYARAALASTRTASDTRTAAAPGFPSIERAAEYLEHYAKYLQEVKLEDIERHPYIPSIQEAAEELRAILSSTGASGEAECDAALGRAAPASQQDACPAILFDSQAVYDEAKRQRPHGSNPTPTQVADTLDAIVRLIRRTASTDVAAGAARQGGNTCKESATSNSTKNGAESPETRMNTSSRTDVNSAAEVDVEAERKLCAAEFGAAWERQDAGKQMLILGGWLAARTQADAGKDAALREAVGRLIKAKGRFHTEQNYKAVVAAYDATTKPENT